MKTVSIVGFGRFGKTLFRLIKDDFIVSVYEKKDSIEKIYDSEVIFFAVPISSFEKVISTHRKYFKKDHLLIDVLSVKLHPAKIFDKYLKGTPIQALLTHPMFGPDSAKEGFEKLPIIIDKFRANQDTYNFWKDYFKSKKLNVLEMSAREHDRLAATSQGLTHFIGRLLEEMKLKSTVIDSPGTKKLLEVIEQTCSDTWQLFTDLQHFNPYTSKMRIKLGNSYDKLYDKLLPKQINPNFIIYGIQGGKGSFNEEAIRYFVQKNNIKNFRIKYLHTSQKVLDCLHKGEIDQGQFAIHNAVGGMVGESIQAMAKYKFAIVEQFAIKISHALMIKKDSRLSEINTIMSHPQVFAQCKDTLSKKYPRLKQISGEGELIDQAIVAKYLSGGKLTKNMATMGSKILAKLYNLKVVEDNLQDAKENYTSFLLVSRT